jgi:hypothetical protein
VLGFLAILGGWQGEFYAEFISESKIQDLG